MPREKSSPAAAAAAAPKKRIAKRKKVAKPTPEKVAKPEPSLEQEQEQKVVEPEQEQQEQKAVDPEPEPEVTVVKKKSSKRTKQKEKKERHTAQFAEQLLKQRELLDELEDTLSSGKLVYKGKLGSLRANLKKMEGSHSVFFNKNRHKSKDSGGLSCMRYISPSMAEFIGKKTNDQIMWREWTTLFAKYMKKHGLNKHSDEEVSGRWVNPDVALNKLFCSPGMFLYTDAQKFVKPHLSKDPFPE